MIRPQNKVAIYVMSCDKTSDVGVHFLSAFNRYWPDCPFNIFWGVNAKIGHLNQSNITPVLADSIGWKTETIQHLKQIKEIAPSLTHVIVCLDDFIFFKKVRTQFIEQITNDDDLSKIGYLRLKRLEESFIGKTFQLFEQLSKVGNSVIFPIRKTHPYFASLQIAIWDINYLISRVEKCNNIWDFEHLKNGDRVHYSVLHSLFNYTHVVEKGEWNYNAKNIVKKNAGFFNPGERKFRSQKFGRSIFHFKHAQFTLFGYMPMRIKQLLKAPK
jgi:hypothetical protein